MRRLPLLAALCTLYGPAPAGEVATPVAAGGKALLPVVVAKDAPARVRQAARTLADYLGRISGAKFDVVEGDGRTGLAVGRAADFPGLPAKLPGDPKDPTATEDYLLR